MHILPDRSICGLRRRPRAGTTARIAAAGLSVFCCAAVLWAAAGKAAAEPVTLTIVHFNDLDRMEERRGRGGMARLAAVVAAERRRAEHLLVTFAGDAISPSLMSGIDKGAHMIGLLNRLGLAAMALGNHEFDFGPEVARRRVAEAAFPVLAANVREPGGAPFAGTTASIAVSAGRFRIGIFGLTTAATPAVSSPGDVVFRPAAETAVEQARALHAAGADLVIALAHTGAAEDAEIRALGVVDVLLSGDDHVLKTEYDGRTLFAESGAQADRVTVIDLLLDETGPPGAERVVWSPSWRVVDTAGVAPDPATAAVVAAHLGTLSKDLDVAVGAVSTGLDSRRAAVRGGEAAIGNLFADAVRWATGADVAVLNGGGIRAARVYAPGARLTRRDVLSELPFGNRTVVIELAGRQVAAAIEHGLGGVEKRAGRFPHVSGLRVVYDPGRPPGRRIVDIRSGGAPLDPDAAYTLATNEFMARGGDGYAVFAGAKRIVDERAGGLLAGQVIRYIAERGTVAPRIDGRMRAAE